MRAAALLAVAACAETVPRTQVDVLLDAERAVRGEAETLRVVVRGGTGNELAGLPERHVSERAVDRETTWPVAVSIVPVANDPARIFEVYAVALDVVGGVVAEVRAKSGFVPREARVLALRLEDRCRGVLCDEDESCRAGQCEDFRVLTANLARLDAGNATPTDGGLPDAATACSSHAECDDAIFCNGFERCIGGVCQAGRRQSCDDGNDCTVDRCSGTGCLNAPDSARCTAAPGGRCDAALGCQYATCTAETCTPGPCQSAVCEGNTCMRASRCEPGQTCCAGACVPAGCSDGIPCTTDHCGADGCLHLPTPEACDDTNACTMGETCASGVCGGGTPVSCDDGNPCTDDACNPGLGCEHRPNVDACDDGDACTVGDQCGAGACRPGAALDCSDGIDCTNDRCVGGACSRVPDDARCTLAPEGTCVVGMGCSYQGCADCTTSDPCQMAMCVAGACQVRPKCAGACCAGQCTDCSDGNPCTADTCSSSGCQHSPTNGACTDNNLCTDDVCAGGTCVSTPRNCDDRSPCTTDSCRPSSGCTYTPVTGPCDDGNACTVYDACNFGTCSGGAQRICDDVNGCTSDACDPATGCTHAFNDGAWCDDGNLCTDGSTCAQGACVYGYPINDGQWCPGEGDCGIPRCENGACVGRSYCTSGACCEGSYCDSTYSCGGGTK